LLVDVDFVSSLFDVAKGVGETRGFHAVSRNSCQNIVRDTGANIPVAGYY
jgi:hypothetical protein